MVKSGELKLASRGTHWGPLQAREVNAQDQDLRQKNRTSKGEMRTEAMTEFHASCMHECSYHSLDLQPNVVKPHPLVFPTIMKSSTLLLPTTNTQLAMS